MALGKAYVAASGDDKKALKYTKDFTVQWYKMNAHFISNLDKNYDLISGFGNGSPSKIQRTNTYALTELRKLLNSNTMLSLTYVNKYVVNVRKYRIKDNDIKRFVYDMCKDLQSEAASVQRINKAAKTYIDKVYRINTWVQNHLKNDKITVSKQ